MRFNHGKRTSVLAALILLGLPFRIFSQQSTGTIRGEIRDLAGQIESGVVIRLVEVSTRSLVQEITPGSSGRFVFRNVPFASYDLRVQYEADVLVTRRVVVNSSVPMFIHIDSLQEFRVPEVIVSGDRVSDLHANLSSATTYTAGTVHDLPAASTSKQIESLLLDTPGVVPDEDGRLHMRGEDAQIQYVVDGIPITGNMTRVYSSLFNAQLIKSVNVLTGSLAAEYGVAASGIIAVTTKSGFDSPFFLNATAGAGSFSTSEGGLQVGGNVGGTTAMFGGVNVSSTERYLDPVTSGDPIHDGGKVFNGFLKIHSLLNDRADASLILGYNSTRYEVPNSVVKSPAQDQVQDLADYMTGVRLNVVMNENSIVSFLGYFRQSMAKVESGGLTTLQSAADYNRAILENEKFFIGGDRRYSTSGAQVELSAKPEWFSASNAFKAGLGAEIYPVHEKFSFAVTNPALSDTNLAGGDMRFRPYDITQGGKPFSVDQSKTGTRWSAYAEDEVNLGRWTFSAGLRFDAFNFLQNESSLSPRIGAAYAASGDLTLRASYNRVVMQAPLENILVSSSDQARALTGAEQGTTPTNVRSEKSHVIELGGLYHLNRHVDLDLVGYGKLIDNFLVKVELGNSGVIFPVNLKQGFVAGGELRARFFDWNDLSGFVSLSTCASYGQKPDDGSSPIAAGLIFGEEGQSYNHPFAGEDMFPTEHNQLLTAVLNVQYRHTSGVSLGLNGRFDSGLPFDLVGKDGKGLDPDQSRAELKRRGYSDSVIDLLTLESDQPGSPDKSVAPHAVFDLFLGYDLHAAMHLPLRLTASIMNVLDTPFLYKFESSFGGTHFGYPRMATIRLEVQL
ncbi:MAG TPA: TonB-dependent receptor [Bacteroidota bacterium]|nr:TonB-dependent receptor [Bacteroidota bacterium]